MKIKIAATAALAFALATPQARASAIIGATEPTQIMNNIQLGLSYGTQIDQLAQQIQQLQTQIQQYETMLKNLEKLSAQDWSQVMNSYNQLVTLVDTAQGLVYSLGNYDETFKAAHPDFQTYMSDGASLKPVDFAAQYQAWNEEMNKKTAAALAAAQATKDGVKGVKQTIEQLNQASQSAEGQLQAIQAGNQFLCLIAQQLEQLKQLQAMQHTAVDTYNANQQARAAASEAAEARAFKTVPVFTSTKRW
jgi:P-type conjugative transfer protein TrbJ